MDANLTTQLIFLTIFLILVIAIICYGIFKFQLWLNSKATKLGVYLRNKRKGKKMKLGITESKVMDCIWNSDKPIGHSSIYEETDIRKNLITEKLKNLESKNYIKLVGKDKTHYNQRLFSPTITYIRDLFLENIESINDETRLNLMKILFSKDAENMDIYEIKKIYLSLVKTE